MVSDDEYELATKRGEDTWANVPHPVEARYFPALERVLIRLSDGLEFALRRSDYGFLRDANPVDLETIQVDGFTVYFPKVDEGFWIPDLLEHLLHVRLFLRIKADEDLANAEAQLQSSRTAA